MLPSAPSDFWDRVAQLVARFIWERETHMPSSVNRGTVLPLRGEPPSAPKEGA